MNLVFDSICRCCLTSEVELKSIFNSFGSIPEAVFLFTAVEFKQNDGLPEKICTNCLQLLNKIINFKRHVEAADLLLREYSNSTASAEKIIMEEDNGTGLLEDNSTNLCDSQPKKTKIDENTEVIQNTKCLTNYRCTVCRRSYANKSSYNRHIKAHEPTVNVFRCNECGKRFRDMSIYENHQMCHTQQKTIIATRTGQMYTCEDCKDVFGAEQDLYVHSSLHLYGNQFNCRGCDKDFENIRKLKRHIPSHFVEKPFKCKKCNMSFAEMASLTRHYKKHTGMKQKSIHICSDCGKGFSCQYTLKVHTRNHTGERPWKCTKCDKQFTDYRLLNSHKKVHEKIKSYECEQCKNRFRHYSSLLTHMRTHTGARPYRCDKCKKSYKQSWSLQVHKRTHIEKKRLLCDQCSQVFSTLSSLKGHLRWHSNQIITDDQDSQTKESFQCKECSAHFLSPLDLITHEKLSHTLRHDHECDICLGKWKTLNELAQHKCDEVTEISDKPTPDEMILLPNGEIQDCNTVVNALLASITNPPTASNQKTAADHA